MSEVALAVAERGRRQKGDRRRGGKINTEHRTPNAE
jgi:hypothetical protein